jgi:membrane protein YdbS with pleckstrin-like domain
MSILINKDGQQLGPFSREQARAKVLAGEVDPLDWAWPEGATDWVPLKDVPGYAAVPAAKPAPLSPGAAAAVAAAPSPAAGAALPPEEELWRGHPSQMLNAAIYLFWLAVLVVTLGGLFLLGVFNQSLDWALGIFGVVALIGVANIAVAYLHLRAIEYVVSTQRVRIISGLFSKNIQEIELFRVKDTMAQQSFFLRLLGLGTITVLSGDEKQPRLVLSGVPRALELRERLRQEVMNLRQRFGVREVDVM